jgi:hypothetical protein
MAQPGPHTFKRVSGGDVPGGSMVEFDVQKGMDRKVLNMKCAAK